jgi:hypothetical protein
MAREPEGEYHGIIIRESLHDQSILKNIRILGSIGTRRWTLLRVGVERKQLVQVIEMVQGNLLTEDGTPYYAHFYRGKELIVVFPRRVFYMKPDPETWSKAVTYGKSLGIPENELDFSPCRFEEETY